MENPTDYLPLFLLIGAPLIVLIWAIAVYNRFVRLKNHCTEAWSNIDTELKRRHELIPNLVSVVKGYAAHERGVFEEVTRLRAACDTRQDLQRVASAERALGGALGRLIAVAEGYPELKADSHFRALQDELVNTEDRIQAARRFYNGNVRDINNLAESFPTSLIAGLGGFKRRDFFEVDPAVRSAPAVQL